VVLRGPRGIEIGEVLVATDTPAEAEGEIVRLLSAADAVECERLRALGQQLLAAACDRAGTLPLAFLDAEVTLDRTVILHTVAWESCEADGLLEELSREFGVEVRLLDLSRTPTIAESRSAGCGKPDCGATTGGCTSCGSGGCSTGSCARGSVKSSVELSAYFSDLRQKMEGAGFVRTPLE
jgi:hypothetical protein